MEGSDLYYKGIYLGSLFEDGTFDYVIDSTDADKMNVEQVAHQLELIRAIAKDSDFNYANYVKEFNEFKFNNDYKFVARF